LQRTSTDASWRALEKHSQDLLRTEKTNAEKINEETTSWLAAETKIRDQSVETESSSRRIRLGELIYEEEEKRRKRLVCKRQ
jgi:hypothetical protein